MSHKELGEQRRLSTLPRLPISAVGPSLFIQP